MLTFVHVYVSLCSDETQFRNCVVWLEDQKIRHYKIEDRGNLRNIPSSDWPKAYQKVRPPSYCQKNHHSDSLRNLGPFDISKIPP